MADIKKRTAIISMLVLGALSIIYAIRGFIIDLTPQTFGIVGLAIGTVLVLEIGVKKLTKVSRLKQLKSQQWIGLVIALVVISTSIGLLFETQIPILTDIANGSFLTGGVWVILEAVTF